MGSKEEEEAERDEKTDIWCELFLVNIREHKIREHPIINYRQMSYQIMENHWM